MLGRVSADNFVILRYYNEKNDIMVRQHQVDIKITEFMHDMYSGQAVSVQCGICYLEDLAEDLQIEGILDRANYARKTVKTGLNRKYAVYDESIRKQLRYEKSIENRMLKSLENEEFLVYFQPKVDLQTGMATQAEALVRWKHPEWGFQSPAEFIPLFEKNGFITKLDQYVWDKTCCYLRRWDDEGYPPVPVSVNVSRADIYHADIADIMVRTVSKYGLTPSRLHLEITESAYTEDPGQIIETVSHLRELGFVIEMDDFGSGYSSLNMLNQMPIDILKLDMTFIRSETAKPADQGVLQFIMELARRMHLSVVAEGVETKEQLDRLGETGCDYVQGYYFARPMPAGDFERLMRDQISSRKKSLSS